MAVVGVEDGLVAVHEAVVVNGEMGRQVVDYLDGAVGDGVFDHLAQRVGEGELGDIVLSTESAVAEDFDTVGDDAVGAFGRRGVVGELEFACVGILSDSEMRVLLDIADEAPLLPVDEGAVLHDEAFGTTLKSVESAIGERIVSDLCERSRQRDVDKLHAPREGPVADGFEAFG